MNCENILALSRSEDIFFSSLIVFIAIANASFLISCLFISF